LPVSTEFNVNIWTSVFTHVVRRLDIYIPESFKFYRLYHWFSRMSAPLFRTRQAIVLTQTPADIIRPQRSRLLLRTCGLLLPTE